MIKRQLDLFTLRHSERCRVALAVTMCSQINQHYIKTCIHEFICLAE